MIHGANTYTRNRFERTGMLMARARIGTLNLGSLKAMQYGAAEGELLPEVANQLALATTKVDVRIIAASSRDLEHEISAGRFRADLYYRLHVLAVSVPPLRDRRDDIPQLILLFTQRHAKRIGRTVVGF